MKLTTHVAFMVNGRLMLQDAIDELRMRFREVQVTLSALKAPARPLPAAWLLPETDGHRLRFIASNYEDDGTMNSRSALARCAWNASPCRCALSQTRSCFQTGISRNELIFWAIVKKDVRTLLRRWRSPPCCSWPMR